jgi:hypothetical protein
MHRAAQAHALFIADAVTQTKPVTRTCKETQSLMITTMAFTVPPRDRMAHQHDA